MAPRSRIAPDVVRSILLSNDADGICAASHGISRQAVQQIRNGTIHRKVLAEIPRRGVTQTHACSTCIHWLHGSCSIGFPEPTENLYFANECNLFQT